MGVIGWIVFGFIVGMIARALMPGRDNMGFIATTVLGIVGGLFAGWLGTRLGWYATDSGAGLIAATIGAIIVLGIYNVITRNKRLGPPKSGAGSDRDRFAA